MTQTPPAVEFVAVDLAELIGIPLRDAIARYAAEEGAAVNSYEWYRDSAKRSGTVWIGALRVPAHKVGGAWHVRRKDLERGLASHRAERDELHRATEDYRRGVLHAKNGDTISTEWGAYRRKDPFHFAWSDYEVMRRRSDGSWYCNSCMKATKTEHDNPECHQCSDWSPCGRDCTLSRIFCEDCGTTQVVASRLTP